MHRRHLDIRGQEMKETWRYTVAKDLQEFGILKSWTEASTVMQERD